VLHLALALLLSLPQQSTDGVRQFIPPVPTPASFISDARHVLSDSAHAALDARIRGLQARGFGDIAVAILPDIGDFTPNDVAVAIYRDWKVGSVAAIGSARRDVGVLILIVPKELAPNKRGQCYIAPGTGAEGIVTDAASGTICRDAIIPLLKTRDYAGALSAGIEAIAARLTRDPGLADSSGSTPDRVVGPLPPGGWFHWWYIPGGIAAFVAWMFATITARRRRPRACPRCGRKMHRVGESDDDAFLEPGQVVEERIKSVDYDVWECDCGEHLVLPYKAFFTSYTKCRECQRRTAKASRHVLDHATTVSSGRARDSYRCKACEATWDVMVTLPIIVASSGGSGSGGGGGGGSSFGGSGSSSGAGGGGSY
jgi:uncharacterized protein